MNGAYPRLATYLIALAIFPLLMGSIITSAYANTQTVKVGSYDCPPFVITDENGNYSGLSIFLWQKMAESLDVNFEISSHELKELLDDVSTGNVDIAVSCISITEERELILDFTHSFYETSLAIAVKEQGHFTTLLNIITNKKLLFILGVVFAAAAFVGGIYYMLEHKVNDKLYSMPSRAARLLEGFLLGLLFITKGPFNYYEFKTLTGRFITVLLAITTTLFIASITAILASTFTLGLLSNDIKGPNDLSNLKVGAKLASTSSIYLTNHSIVHRTYESTDEMLTALDSREVDAIVADNAVLKYLIKKFKEEGNYTDLSVLPYQFEKQNYGFAIGDNSPYEEALNRALLKVRKSPEWKQALSKYFAER
ncbi:substrate-binding periplasmic protein [Photobacterium sanguinicancri]|uniref:ABC transporter substrate-binding protein n=1 Tax=Photobacterium sanguinicancri TaxID=875932 RepID=A0ABX4FZA1_9GAMM|nr:transporter substrate-binding domain-containing protein [Photobacterium sanguinicancri]MDO6498096.1 transporter substrate-binding domain-containing protein [Photobacterium sanguinicancri]OZS44178.1 ABC transporter substrate-binding protein [Photobacterium sanguinicancri]